MIQLIVDTFNINVKKKTLKKIKKQKNKHENNCQY